MKNVVYIIIDAFCYHNLERRIGGKEVTPFLNRLCRESVCFTNMYAQAPYTEASQVTLLSGENTLDSGGYLFGNGTTGSSVFTPYRENGYRTLFSYSPYVYSKGYLREVDRYYYTRFYSIEPLFLYRLGYYHEKWKQDELQEQEREVCRILLEEALETWMQQCRRIIDHAPEMELIRHWVRDGEAVHRILGQLKKEQEEFRKNPDLYLDGIFQNRDSHVLRRLNREFVQRAAFPWRKNVPETQNQKRLEEYQKKYSKLVRKQSMDINYVFGMLFRNRNGYSDARSTFSAYRRHYRNDYLSGYQKSIDESAKTEVSMNRAFEVYLKDMREYERKGEHYYAYIHMQDFHLPSVFHTLDTDDDRLVQQEFEEAFGLLEDMDETYRGNILADLSAHYCDRKVEAFFRQMQRELQEEFVFVVTADHGFPSYENPPRPMIYNQTYTEAFHIPFIMYDGEHREKKEGFYSDMDAVHFICQAAGVKQQNPILPREYVLCEYGGPGCPDIGVKPIWYTYIDAEYRISIECSLKHDITEETITAVFDLKRDPMQKKDLVKLQKRNPQVLERCKIVQKRHEELRAKYQQGRFLASQLDRLKENHNFYEGGRKCRQ